MYMEEILMTLNIKYMTLLVKHGKLLEKYKEIQDRAINGKKKVLIINEKCLKTKKKLSTKIQGKFSW